MAVQKTVTEVYKADTLQEYNALVNDIEAAYENDTQRSVKKSPLRKEVEVTMEDKYRYQRDGGKWKRELK